MAQDKTKQKEDLLAYLRESDTPQSTEQIVSALRARGAFPAQSTVYRLIRQMCDEGSVKCIPQDKKFLYQLVPDNSCRHHLHLKCTQFGKLLHMDHEQSERLIEDIYGENAFSVSEADTTLYGTCGQCAGVTGK